MSVMTVVRTTVKSGDNQVQRQRDGQKERFCNHDDECTSPYHFRDCHNDNGGRIDGCFQVAFLTLRISLVEIL